MTAPTGPVAWAKVRGSENIPAPIIDPTTMEASAANERDRGFSDVMVAS
jgi:hypothetical protein